MVTLAEVLEIYMIVNSLALVMAILLLESQINSLSKALDTLLEEIIKLRKKVSKEE